ncbi:hypothetical protein H8K32_05580 [Undibacterium jejuense]|uniref:Chemotaxis methyl-accepting receptor HlyB-like 4HB MCP domain-containing protein n=1 Tax=Undibacterium jejuense TaxID=1344949 RepID=A0A923HEG7_9BURK|nr:hypothetical protein [Undibacterium jejuense]MBC3861565.1 hypothetical protein [Undibacterium jejuense]
MSSAMLTPVNAPVGGTLQDTLHVSLVEADLYQVSEVPQQLKLRRALCVALSVCVFIAAFFVFDSYRSVVNTVGKDAVPSIVAAEQIRSRLADAHTNLMDLFLLKEEANGASGKAYIAAINQAHNKLLSAAQNITFGDEERKPILTAMTLLSEYERVVGMALVTKDSHDLLLKADTLMREHILPAVVELDNANFTHLASSYAEGRQAAKNYFVTFLLLSILLIVALIEAQVKMFAIFKRIVNPVMLSGLLVFIASISCMAIKIDQISSDLRTAKEDAFDSVHVLSQAQALAYSANAQESMYLLMTDKQVQAKQTALFADAADKIFSSKIGAANALISNPKELKGHGLLADELVNVTFPGEHQAAVDTLKAWVEYVYIDKEIRQLEASGKHEQALALCIGKLEHQSDWAFDRFNAALSKTLMINQAQFDDGIARAMSSIKQLVYLLALLLFAPVLGTIVGIQKRLVEFRE